MEEELVRLFLGEFDGRIRHDFVDAVEPGVVFQDLQIMQLAAKAGQGVSLGDHLTSRTAMERGELMQVHPFELPSPRAYWLVQGNALPSESAQAFEAWLLAEL